MKTIAEELEAMAEKFSEGWHDGIKIDASDVMLLCNAANELRVLQGKCDIPPEGWKCTREKGHEGPCAAVPLSGTIEDVEDSLKLKEDVVVLKNAIFCVLEGFTLPHDARKILESVLWRD